MFADRYDLPVSTASAAAAIPAGDAPPPRVVPRALFDALIGPLLKGILATERQRTIVNMLEEAYALHRATHGPMHVVEGAVPGAKGGWITVRDAVKKKLGL